MAVNYSELAVLVGAISGSVATLIFATQKSRCSEIKTPCITCVRPIPNTGECYDLESQLKNVANPPELQCEQVINQPQTDGQPIPDDRKPATPSTAFAHRNYKQDI